MKIEYEDAMVLLMRWLQEPDHGGYSSYGYDIYLPNLARVYLRKEKGMNSQMDIEQNVGKLVTSLYHAAWDLCRRGILRPGVYQYGAQTTDEGTAGSGYSVTPFGRQWLLEKDQDAFVPTEPERFAKMLAPHKEKLGAPFHERAQEAIRCYGAHAYLACCVMCGAAAESIVLKAAIQKGNETDVIKEYCSASGRSRIENRLFGQARQQLRDEYKGYTMLLKYWRDLAAHGAPANINDNEAYTALALLLRFAMFFNGNWEELVSA